MTKLYEALGTEFKEGIQYEADIAEKILEDSSHQPGLNTCQTHFPVCSMLRRYWRAPPNPEETFHRMEMQASMSL